MLNKDMDIERVIRRVVENVVAELSKTADGEPSPAPCGRGAGGATKITCGECGVFDDMDEAVEAADAAQKIYYSQFKLKDREKIVSAIRDVCAKEADTLARMVHEETRIGHYPDKIAKHMVVITKTPGPEIILPQAISGDDGLTLEEFAPFGVIGAITPVTNPTETLICNVISMISAGNSVVFNVHPQSKNACAHCVRLINTAIMEAGGPEHLVCMVREPSLETSRRMSDHPKVRLLSCIGGTAMVNEMLRSGKKVIGAGAGNPPVVVDESADLKKAGEQIFAGASFDNNLLCISEKVVFAADAVADELIYHLAQAGAFMLSPAQLDMVTELVLTNDGGRHRPNKDWIGQDAGKILRQIRVDGRDACRLLICEVENDHPLVGVEQLMPVLPIVRCANFDQACERAVAAERGLRHTASIFSKNVYNMTKFAKMIETTIFVANSATLAGVGYGGEGGGTMGIAGPTGEGATNALSYTRKRRFVLADGGFRVI
jgi:propionaldehyde dehydrogenase